MSSAVSDKNHQFDDCVKDINLEQNYLDKMYTAENNISDQNIGMNFNFFFNSKILINKKQLV